MPPRRRTALVCELHAHTRWSDGSLTLPELVDLYGDAGFDVLCVTDHVVAGEEHVHAGNHAAYLAAIDVQAARARERHGLLLLPGLELTDDHEDPAEAAHVVAVGLRRFVGLERGLDAAVIEARAAGAALIAAHPYTPEQAAAAQRATTRFAVDRAWAAEAVDRFELFNRHELFGWVAEARLPAVASGDAHEVEHLHTWKTGLPCEQHPEAVVEYLRSRRPAFLVPAPAGASLARARAS